MGKNIEDSLVIILPCFLSIYTIQTLKVNQACCLGPVLTERLTRRPLFRFYTKYKALHARIQANNVTSTYNTPSARPKSDIILTNSTNSHYNRSVVHVSFPSCGFLSNLLRARALITYVCFRSHKEEKNTDDGNSAANSPTKGATTPTPTPVQTSFRR